MAPAPCPLTVLLLAGYSSRAICPEALPLQDDGGLLGGPPPRLHREGRGRGLTLHKWFYLVTSAEVCSGDASGHCLNLRTPKEIRRRADVQARLKILEARRNVPEEMGVHAKQAPCGMSLLGSKVRSGYLTHGPSQA